MPRRPFELVLATGFAIGALAAWATLSAVIGPPQRHAAAAPAVVRPSAGPTLEQRAERELARSRAARRRVAPTSSGRGG